MASLCYTCAAVGGLILLRGRFGNNAAKTLASKLCARSFIQVPECADVQVECELSNDSGIRCASEPGRTDPKKHVGDGVLQYPA
jgi:hypothetical protein